MVLAVTYPWASASSYLSSQSVADSRCNPHATPRNHNRDNDRTQFFTATKWMLQLARAYVIPVIHTTATQLVRTPSTTMSTTPPTDADLTHNKGPKILTKRVTVTRLEPYVDSSRGGTSGRSPAQNPFTLSHS